MNVSHFFKSLNYVIQRFVLRKTHIIAESDQYDLIFKVKTEDGGGRKIFKKGIYEEDLSAFLLKYLKPESGDIYVDIGANIGWYSILLSSHFKGQPSIYSFEPDEDNFSCLVENIALNACENVTANKLAIAHESGHATMYRYKSSNTGRHSLLPINKGLEVSVKIISLDQFIEEKAISFSKIKFLKMDIEGYELRAFQGAEKVLDYVPLILAEYSPVYMRKGNVNPEELVDCLISRHYVPHMLIDGMLQIVAREVLLKQSKNLNLFWLKST